MRLTKLAALVLLAAACKPGARADDPAAIAAHADSVKAGIDAMNASFTAHMIAGHADSVAAFYTADANVQPPNMPALHGMDAIKAGMTGMLAQGAPSAFTLRAVDVAVSGDMAIERGRWTWQQMMPNHMVMSDSGKYIVRWVKDGSTWKMADDMWNSDNPPMAMPPAPPARRS